MKARALMSLTCLGLVLGFGPASPAGASPPPPETILPADTDLVVHVPDFTRLRTDWAQSPLGELWRDPAFAALRQERGIGWDDEALAGKLGTSLGTILENFTGGMAIALQDLPTSSEVEELGPVGLLAEVKDSRFFVSVLGRLLVLRQDASGEDETVREREESYRGTTLHLRRYLRGGELWALEGWTVLDNLVIVGGPESYLKSLVTWTQTPPPAPFSSSPAYREAKRRIPEADLVAFLDLSTVGEIAEDRVSSGLEEEGAAAAGLSDRILDALALDELQGSYFAVNLEEGMTQLDTGVLYHEPKGILGLAAYLPGPCIRPSFLPADVVSASLARFDFQAAWKAVLDLVEAIQPGFGAQVGGQLTAYGDTLGVNLERDLLGNLGENLWWVELPGERDPDQPFFLHQVVGIEVSDTATLGRVMESLLLVLDPAGTDGEDLMVEGVVIHSLRFGNGEGFDGNSPSYAVHDGWFLSGTRAAVETMVEAMQHPGPSLWERPELKPLFASVPENASYLTYQDGLKSGTQMFRLLDQAHEEGLETDEHVSQEARDAILRALGPVIAYGVKTDHGLFGTARLMHTVQ